jgi:hypothetical protein
MLPLGKGFFLVAENDVSFTQKTGLMLQDSPVDIGNLQMSAPQINAKMLELLEPPLIEKATALDVGSGAF